MSERSISTIEELISKVTEDYRSLKPKTLPWFRGEPNNIQTPLIPKLYRKSYDENSLLQQFRTRAPVYVDIQIPQREHTAQWLFLGQHVGLPTRLLDWTEGLLIALHFALNHEKGEGGVIWMLHPIELNKLSDPGFNDNEILIPWFSPELSLTMWIRTLLNPDKRREKNKINFARYFLQQLNKAKIEDNIGNINIRAAWENNPEIGTDFPVAIYPIAIHPRITVQKSCFTIWGKKRESLTNMVDSKILCKYVIVNTNEKIDEMKKQLQMLGITQSSLYPDLDHLAQELSILNCKPALK